MAGEPIGVMDPNQFAFVEAIEKLIRHCRYTIEYGGESTAMTTRRIKSRPYQLQGVKSSCRVIMNRGAHWNPHFNSFFLIVAPSVYLINDMIAFRSIDKNVSYGHMSKLGIKVPKTYAIPQFDNSETSEDAKVNPDLIFSYHELFNLEEIGREVGYPAYLKPQDGGGWVGVERVENYESLLKAYRASGKKPQNLQAAVEYREFVRTVGVGPTMMPMHYNADAKHSHDRYLRSATRAVEHDFLSPKLRHEVSAVTKVINAFYGWDHNSCEALIDKSDGVHPIDFANAYPDSSPVSLHFYFPDLVKAMVKWLIFIAATKRKKRVDFAYHWPRFFTISDAFARGEIDYAEALRRYETIADEHFDTHRFEDFCAEKLADFDEKALEFFEGDEMLGILEGEVTNYFKIPSERPEKLSHYNGLFAFWCHCERDRIDRRRPKPQRDD